MWKHYLADKSKLIHYLALCTASCVSPWKLETTRNCPEMMSHPASEYRVASNERCHKIHNHRSATTRIAKCMLGMLVQNIIRLTIEWLLLLLILQFGDRVIEAIWWTHSFRWHKQQVTSGIVYKKRCPTVYVTGWQSISVNSCVFNHGCSHRSTVHSEN